jgi:hypothetical protein
MRFIGTELWVRLKAAWPTFIPRWAHRCQSLRSQKNWYRFHGPAASDGRLRKSGITLRAVESSFLPEVA